MKTWRIGAGTLSIGLIGIGVLLLLNYSGLITNQIFQYVGPIYIILFGIEVVWSYFGSREQRQRFSSWSVIILIIAFITSSTHMAMPNNFDWQPRFLSTVEGNFPMDSAIKRVEIRIPDGKVEVIGTTSSVIKYSGQLLVNAPTQAKADSALETRWKAQMNGDTLELILERVGPKWNLFSLFNWSQKKAHLEVQIPQSLLTAIETSNGSVQVSDMNGDSEIDTSNGSITVINVNGNVKADTSNGAAIITDLTGSLDLKSSNGSLTLTNVSGEVVAKTSNGAIRGSSAINGDWDVKSSNGKITLAIPEATNAEIEADTSNGRIGGDFEWQDGDKSHGEGTIGTGEYKVSLETSNGSIDVDTYAGDLNPDQAAIAPIAPLADEAPSAPSALD